MKQYYTNFEKHKNKEFLQMVKSNLLTSISLDIDTFKAHLKRISREGYVVHKLDKDLLLQKTRDFYDKISQIEASGEFHLEMPAKPEIKAVETKTEIVKKPVKQEIKPVVLEVEPEKTIEKKVEVVQREEIIPLVDIEEKKISPLEEEITDADTSISIEFNDVSETKQKPDVEFELPPIKPEITTEKNESPRVESNYDLFSTSSSETLSDKFATKEEKSVADKLKLSKLEDLRSAIGINEKFLFINELFNGDMGRYNKALDELNSMQNKNGIDTYFMELKIEKQWNEEDDAFIKFKELVDRKFN